MNVSSCTVLTLEIVFREWILCLAYFQTNFVPLKLLFKRLSNFALALAAAVAFSCEVKKFHGKLFVCQQDGEVSFIMLPGYQGGC